MKASRNNFHAAGFGKVAPWVDLANSEEWNGFGKLTDHLTNAPWLTTFLKHWNLHPLTSKDVPRRKLVQLRALLRCAAEKLAAGGALNRRELSSLNKALNVPGRQKLVQGQNGFRAEMVPVHNDWSWVIRRIAASFGEMLANRFVQAEDGIRDLVPERVAAVSGPEAHRHEHAQVGGVDFAAG